MLTLLLALLCFGLLITLVVVRRRRHRRELLAIRYVLDGMITRDVQ